MLRRNREHVLQMVPFLGSVCLSLITYFTMYYGTLVEQDEFDIKNSIELLISYVL